MDADLKEQGSGGQDVALAAVRRAARKARIILVLVLLLLAAMWSAFMRSVGVFESWSETALGVVIFAVVFGTSWWWLSVPGWVRRPPETLETGVVSAMKVGVLHVRAGSETVVADRTKATRHLKAGDRVGVTPLRGARRKPAIVIPRGARRYAVVTATVNRGMSV